MKVIGIDPGLATVGIGIVEAVPLCVLDWCTIETKKGLSTSARLAEIAADVVQLLHEYEPDLAVVEKLYFEKNQKTAMDVAQARGVILCELERSAIAVLEPTPMQLKMAITGDGAADKRQMQDMLKLQLGVDCPSDDAADALGLALFGTFSNELILNT